MNKVFCNKSGKWMVRYEDSSFETVAYSVPASVIEAAASWKCGTIFYNGSTGRANPLQGAPCGSLGGKPYDRNHQRVSPPPTTRTVVVTRTVVRDNSEAEALGALVGFGLGLALGGRR